MTEPCIQYRGGDQQGPKLQHWPPKVSTSKGGSAEKPATGDVSIGKEAPAIKTIEEAAASKKIAEEDAINDAAAKNATRELPPEEIADTETVEINTTNDAAVADIEDYANNTAEDKAPQAPSGDYIEAETTSDDDVKTEATGYDDIKAEATSDDDIKAEATIDDNIKAEATSDDEHIKARNREEAPAKSPPPEKPVHRANMSLVVILLLMAAPLLISTTFLGPYPASTMASSSMPATLSHSSAHSPIPVYMYKARPYRSKKCARMIHWYGHDVWPNSRPRGGGGYIHHSIEDHAHYMHHIMLTHDMKSEDITSSQRQVASHYEDTHHAWYLSNHHSPKPDMYEGSARISLTEGKDQFDLPDQHRCVPAPEASKIMLYEKLLGIDRYKDPYVKPPYKSYVKKYADRVYSVYHLKSLLRQEDYHWKMAKSKSSHREALAQLDMKERDHWKKVRTKNSKMEYHNELYMEKNTHDAPSSVRHPESPTSISLNPDQSHQVAKKVLRMFKYKRKTSSDVDTDQDQDLAAPEGLSPPDGITGYHVLPV